MSGADPSPLCTEHGGQIRYYRTDQGQWYVENDSTQETELLDGPPSCYQDVTPEKNARAVATPPQKNPASTPSPFGRASDYIPPTEDPSLMVCTMDPEIVARQLQADPNLSEDGQVMVAEAQLALKAMDPETRAEVVAQALNPHVDFENQMSVESDLPPEAIENAQRNVLAVVQEMNESGTLDEETHAVVYAFIEEGESGQNGADSEMVQTAQMALTSSGGSGEDAQGAPGSNGNGGGGDGSYANFDGDNADPANLGPGAPAHTNVDGAGDADTAGMTMTAQSAPAEPDAADGAGPATEHGSDGGAMALQSSLGAADPDDHEVATHDSHFCTNGSCRGGDLASAGRPAGAGDRPQGTPAPPVSSFYYSAANAVAPSLFSAVPHTLSLSSGSSLPEERTLGTAPTAFSFAMAAEWADVGAALLFSGPDPLTASSQKAGGQAGRVGGETVRGELVEPLVGETNGPRDETGLVVNAGFRGSGSRHSSAIDPQLLGGVLLAFFARVEDPETSIENPWVLTRRAIDSGALSIFAGARQVPLLTILAATTPTGPTGKATPGYTIDGLARGGNLGDHPHKGDPKGGAGQEMADHEGGDHDALLAELDLEDGESNDEAGDTDFAQAGVA